MQQWLVCITGACVGRRLAGARRLCCLQELQEIQPVPAHIGIYRYRCCSSSRVQACFFFSLSSFSSFQCSSKRCWRYRKAVLEMQKLHRDQQGDVQHGGCRWPQNCCLLHGEHPMQQQKGADANPIILTQGQKRAVI